ncbi:MAG: hypothetical protein ACYDC9_11300, partial [Dermatophilaceae bacterium]
MVRVRDVLHSFRPAGAPGAAGAAGVPADRGADIAAELEPVFAQLARTEHECVDIAVRAGQTAAKVRAGEAERARATLAAARERMDAERAAAVAQMRPNALANSTAAAVAAEREVVEIRRRAGEHMGSYVDLVVASVGRLIDDGQLS